MAGKLVMGMFALGVLVLAIALLFTPVLDFTTSDNVKYIEIDNQTNKTVTDRLDLEALNVNDTNATFELENTDDFNTTSNLVNTTENRTFNLSNEKLYVNLTAITVNGTTAQTSVRYPPTFGMNSYVATFFESIDTLIALLAFMVVIIALGRAF